MEGRSLGWFVDHLPRVVLLNRAQLIRPVKSWTIKNRSTQFSQRKAAYKACHLPPPPHTRHNKCIILTSEGVHRYMYNTCVPLSLTNKQKYIYSFCSSLFRSKQNIYWYLITFIVWQLSLNWDVYCKKINRYFGTLLSIWKTSF